MGSQRLEHRDLVGDLGAAEQAEQRALRLADHAEVFELTPQQVSGGGALDVADHADRGCVGPVRGAEGVVHVDIGERGQGPGEVRIVLGLPGVEAQVLEEQELSVLQLPHRLSCALSDDLLGEGDPAIQQLRPAGPPRGAGRAPAAALPSDAPDGRRAPPALRQRAVGAVSEAPLGSGCRRRRLRRRRGTFRSARRKTVRPRTPPPSARRESMVGMATFDQRPSTTARSATRVA